MIRVTYTEYDLPAKHWRVSFNHDDSDDEVIIGNIAFHEESDAVVFVPIPGFMFGYQIMEDIAKKIKEVEGNTH